MPRWMLYSPMVALVLASAVIGLSLGRKTQRDTASDVIQRISARYVREEGGSADITDCHARPAASSGLSMVVTCMGADGRGREYYIDLFNDVTHVEVLGQPDRQ